MDEFEILKLVDHTVLKQTTVWCDIKNLCDDAIRYNTASVCLPPCFVNRAKEYVQNRMKICTVVGFPNGYSTLNTKCTETEEALKNGADEIDMVINICDLKDKNYNSVLREIGKLKELCKDKILKVIVETCLLTEQEKIEMCKIVSQSGANYIKTSTGFSTSGATVSDIKLFAKNITGDVKIKAAGGISSFEDAKDLILAGASRLGTSRLVQIMKTKEQ